MGYHFTGWREGKKNLKHTFTFNIKTKDGKVQTFIMVEIGHDGACARESKRAGGRAG